MHGGDLRLAARAARTGPLRRTARVLALLCLSLVLAAVVGVIVMPRGLGADGVGARWGCRHCPPRITGFARDPSRSARYNEIMRSLAVELDGQAEWTYETASRAIVMAGEKRAIDLPEEEARAIRDAARTMIRSRLRSPGSLRPDAEALLRAAAGESR